MAAGANNRFGLLVEPAVLIALTSSWLIVLLFFASHPAIDTTVSTWVFDPGLCSDGKTNYLCRGFPGYDLTLLNVLRSVLQIAPTVLAVLIGLSLLGDWLRGRGWPRLAARDKLILVATMVLGPGLFANVLLKEHWGRPRPWMTTDFGGWLPFVEAGRISDYCDSNCSFISGEAASAGWLASLAILLLLRGRKTMAAGVLAVAILTAVLRIFAGAHYLSDVVLGFYSSIVIFALVAAVVEAFARREV